MLPRLWTRILRCDRVSLAPRLLSHDPVVEQLSQALAAGARAREPFGRLYREGLLTALVAHLAAGSVAGRQLSPVGGLAPWRLKRVLAYIEAHVGDDVSLGELAALVDLSERHFCTSFRQSMGEPPHRYLVHRRIERAKDLMRSDKMISMTEVAQRVGFKSSAHFSALFHTLHGSTPSSYRASC